MLSLSSFELPPAAASMMSDDNNLFTTLLSGGLMILTSFVVVLARSNSSSSSPSKSQRRLSSSSSSTEEPFVYLDYNGTTPIYPEVLDAMMPFFQDHYGNPSSSHAMGTIPRQAIDKSRRQLLTLLGVSPTSSSSQKEEREDLESIWFTACGTESDNLAIAIALQSYRYGKEQNPHYQQPPTPPSSSPTTPRRLSPRSSMNSSMRSLGSNASQREYLPHIVTTNVEHPAVELYLKRLEEQREIVVTRVPVQPQTGIVQASDVMVAMMSKPNTILVTIMLANNESGALQPIRPIAQACRRKGILCHTDAAQAVGKVSVHLQDVLGGVDMVSIVGHKVGAPKGIACLYVRPGCYQEYGRALPPGGVMLLGGGQEHGRRGGTENTPYIVGLGHATSMISSKSRDHMESLRQRLLTQLQDQLGGPTEVKPNGPTDPKLRLPNTLSVGIRGIQSGTLLRSIGHLVAASAGATCHSTGGGVSSVLQAMQIDPVFARGTLRLSVGPTTTTMDIDRAVNVIAQAVQEQRQQNQENDDDARVVISKASSSFDWSEVPRTV